jgi:hypothetical protein
VKSDCYSFVMSVCLSVCMEQLASHWTDLHEIWCLRIFRISVENVQVSSKCNNIGYFRWRPTHIICHWILLVMRDVSDKICVEILKTHHMLNNFFPKIMSLWDIVEEYGRVREATEHNITRSTRFAWWIAKVTNTHSEYVILFHGSSGYANAHHCYVIPTLTVLYCS